MTWRVSIHDLKKSLKAGKLVAKRDTFESISEESCKSLVNEKRETSTSLVDPLLL